MLQVRVLRVVLEVLCAQRSCLESCKPVGQQEESKGPRLHLQSIMRNSAGLISGLAVQCMEWLDSRGQSDQAYLVLAVQVSVLAGCKFPHSAQKIHFLGFEFLLAYSLRLSLCSIKGKLGAEEGKPQNCCSEVCVVMVNVEE